MDVFLTAGITLGLSAGFSPGPLTTLVISQSLRHGTGEGLKVALAPLLTDVPIILASVLVLAQLRDSHIAFGVISMLGATVLCYLSYQTFKVDRVEVEPAAAEPRSIGKGVLVNFLSPHAYLFWLTIGGPRVVEAWTLSPLIATGFVAGFYVCLVGSKMLMAIIAGRSKRLLAGTVYRTVMRLLGGALLALALLVCRDGLMYFNVLGP